MKCLTVYMHTRRAGAVVDALLQAGMERVAFSVVSGMLNALTDEGHAFSVELGSEVLREAKLEIVCEDEQVAEALGLIRTHARTGQAVSGYVVITEVLECIPISGGPAKTAPS